jgi:NADPH:quinone reductase-like Zn-dependent oxidoreductase
MDIMQREGKYPLPPQASKTIMGVEFSGEIVSMNEKGLKSFNGEEWKEGDEVFGLAYGVRSILSLLSQFSRLIQYVP